MNYAGIKDCDIANGIGCRTVLFVSGCRNHCKDCFQPHTWDFDYGAPFEEAIWQEVLDSLAPAYVQGLTLLGGEPFEPENQIELVKFVRKVKEQYPNKDIWAFTGYVYDKDLVKGGRKHCEATEELISYIDVLVDGPFIAEEKDLRLKFRGSRNQRIIDVKQTLEAKAVILSQYHN